MCFTTLTTAMLIMPGPSQARAALILAARGQLFQTMAGRNVEAPPCQSAMPGTVQWDSTVYLEPSTFCGKSYRPQETFRHVTMEYSNLTVSLSVHPVPLSENTPLAPCFFLLPPPSYFELFPFLFLLSTSFPSFLLLFLLLA